MTADVLLKLVLSGEKNVLKFVNHIKSNWFETSVDRVLWKQLVKYIKVHGSVPSTDLVEELLSRDDTEKTVEDVKIRLEYLKNMVVSNVDKDVVSTEVKLMIERETIQEFLETGAQLVEKGKPTDVWLLIDTKKAELLSISDDISPVSILNEKEVLRRYRTKTLPELGTLIHSLDTVLGGIHPGTLTVILGVTSVGKTMFLVYLSVAFILQGQTVLFISLEDSKQVIDNRFDVLWFGEDCDVSALMKRRKMLETLSCSVYTEYMNDLSVSKLKNLVDSYQHKGVKIDSIVIDYGDLMTSDVPVGTKDEYMLIGKVFESLMQYGGQTQINIITATQGNRDALSQRVVTLKNIGGSFKKAQVAHYILALCQTPEEYEKDILRLFVCKNKYGRANFIIPVQVVRERQFFRELQDPSV